MVLSTFICMRTWHEYQMFTRVLLSLNLKIKKKLDAIRSSFVVRTWRILNIFAIFCFITSKKGRKQLKQGKSCVEFTKCRQKTPVPELICPIPWWWFFSQRRSSLLLRLTTWLTRLMKWKVQAFNGSGTCYCSKSVRWKCSWPFEIARLRKEVRYLGTAWVERNSSDESHERLRSTHQTRRKRSVLEAYDYGRQKMDCLQQCQPKKKWSRRDEAPER